MGSELTGCTFILKAQFGLQLFLDIGSHPMEIPFRQQVSLAEQNDRRDSAFVEQTQSPNVFFIQGRSCVNQKQRKVARRKIGKGLRGASSGQGAKSRRIHQHDALLEAGRRDFNHRTHDIPQIAGIPLFRYQLREALRRDGLFASRGHTPRQRAGLFHTAISWGQQ